MTCCYVRAWASRSSRTQAGVAVIGQPNVAARRLDNPIVLPGALSFLAYGTFQSYVRGLEEFPEEVWRRDQLPSLSDMS